MYDKSVNHKSVFAVLLYQGVLDIIVIHQLAIILLPNFQHSANNIIKACISHHIYVA